MPMWRYLAAHGDMRAGQNGQALRILRATTTTPVRSDSRTACVSGTRPADKGLLLRRLTMIPVKVLPVADDLRVAGYENSFTVRTLFRCEADTDRRRSDTPRLTASWSCVRPRRSCVRCVLKQPVTKAVRGAVSVTLNPHAPYWRLAPEPAHCADSGGQELLTSSCVFPRKLIIRPSRSIVAHPPVRDIVYVAVERQVERVAVWTGSVVQRELRFGEHDRSGRADELAVLGRAVADCSRCVSTDLVHLGGRPFIAGSSRSERFEPRQGDGHAAARLAAGCARSHHV